MALVLKILFTLVSVMAWLGTQKLLGSRKAPSGSELEIRDLLHDVTEKWNRALNRFPKRADLLLVSSSLVVDALGVFLLASAIFGSSVRPLLGLLFIFTLRQINQAVTMLPVPKGMIWRDPGFPSLLVTYGVSQDLFFSGHTALSVFGAMELVRLGGPLFLGLGIAIALFEILTVIALRAHWTMDVFAGAVTALLMGDVAARLAPFIDRWIS